MSYDYNKILALQDALAQYVEAESSPITEAVRATCDAAKFPDYVSREFLDSVITEMERMLKFFKNNSRIVEKEITATHRYSELEWED